MSEPQKSITCASRSFVSKIGVLLPHFLSGKPHNFIYILDLCYLLGIFACEVVGSTGLLRMVPISLKA